MRHLFLCLLLLATACNIQSPKATTTRTTNSKAKSPEKIIQGKVISIKDGDSLELLDENNEIHQIRLAHVDCPEKKQPFGTKAKIFTSNFCFGKIVTAYEESKDRYGRKICIVEAEGEELNLAIIEAGFGWHYVKYSDSAVHAAAEQRARKGKRGLWVRRDAVAPWAFRKRKK